MQHNGDPPQRHNLSNSIRTPYQPLVRYAAHNYTIVSLKNNNPRLISRLLNDLLVTDFQVTGIDYFSSKYGML